MFELGSARGKQLFTNFDMGVHRTADIEQQQQFDIVAPLRAHLNIQQPGIASGVVDGAIDIQLIRCALAGEFT